jgi:hypothetical protein
MENNKKICPVLSAGWLANELGRFNSAEVEMGTTFASTNLPKCKQNECMWYAEGLNECMMVRN